MNLQELIKKSFESGMTYAQYRAMTQDLLAENKTTGENQSEDMVHYTKLNEQRMHRLDKKIDLQPDVLAKLIDNPEMKWLVITEPWCGDASQLVPLFHKMAESNEMIDLRIVLRDEHPVLMDNFEYKGSRAIPVLVLLDKQYQVIARWGARPEPAQAIVEEYKAKDPKPPYAELTTQLQKWYNKDKTITSQNEIVRLLNLPK